MTFAAFSWLRVRCKEGAVLPDLPFEPLFAFWLPVAFSAIGRLCGYHGFSVHTLLGTSCAYICAKVYTVRSIIVSLRTLLSSAIRVITGGIEP